jgi:hypothetical protein
VTEPAVAELSFIDLVRAPAYRAGPHRFASDPQRRCLAVA